MVGPPKTEVSREDHVLGRLRGIPERIERVEFLARMLPIILGRVERGSKRRGP